MDLGDALRFRTDITDSAGALVNATAITLTVTLPDGTTTAPSVANPPAVTGKYFADYQTTVGGLPGRYVGKFLATMPGGLTTAYEESFDLGSSLVSVDEAAGQLRSAGVITSADDLEQLQWLCLVATEAVEDDLGRVFTRRTVVETRDGGDTKIHLFSTPVISVTSVVESGVTLTAGNYLLNTSAGILYRGTGTYSQHYAYGRQNVVITYVAGYTNPPYAIRMGALLIVQQMWQASQQASHPLLDESDTSSGNVAQWVTEALAGMPAPLRGAYESHRAPGIA